MNSNWRDEVLAILNKEIRTEMRSRTGLMSAGLFSVVAVVAIAFASYQDRLSPSLSAGMLWVTLLFSSMVALPRAFVGEEEAGTADLLRLVSRPHAVFWGKAIFNWIQMMVTALAISLLFFVLTSQNVHYLWLFAFIIVAGCACLSGAVTLCGAMVAQASNRAALAGAIGIPLLLPLIALGIGATRYCLGATNGSAAMSCAMGLGAYAVAVFATGPWLFEAIWKA